MAQAFLGAGVKSVMVANWAISSNATVKLMELMFDEINKDPSLSYSSALNEAQRQLKKNDGYGHPAFWAPFTIFGGL